MSFGETLKLWMDKQGINAYELSQIADVPVQTIYSMIKRNSKKADVHNIIRIAKALGVSIDELLTSEETKTVFPNHFSTTQDAMRFLLAQPVIEGFNDVNIGDLDEDTILEFITEVLGQMKLVSFKYKKKE